MDRSQFYHKVTVDGVNELDIIWNPISGFTMNYKPAYYRVINSDLMRPDLISWKCYGTVEFWWIIMVVNNIENPLTDLSEGQVLTIPHRLDIYDFQMKYKV